MARQSASMERRRPSEVRSLPSFMAVRVYSGAKVLAGAQVGNRGNSGAPELPRRAYPGETGPPPTYPIGGSRQILAEGLQAQ
jgi:hypothetical protein